MTIVDVKNKLITYFMDKSIFCMETNSLGITLGGEAEEFKEELFRTALNELTEQGVVKKLSSSKNESWILSQPISSLNQSVYLSAGVVEVIANTINSFRDANDIETDACDKTKITEKDIVHLIGICHALSEEEEKEKS